MQEGFENLRPLKVVFIHAPDSMYSNLQNYGAKFMPVWAYVLAAHLADEGRYEMSLFDLRFEDRDDVSEADIYLFSGINQDCASLLSVKGYLKEKYPSARTMIGGPICWSFDQAGCLEQLDTFDHIFIGDGEEMIAGLLQSLSENSLPDHVIRAEKRFDIANKRPMHKGLLERTIGRYYGAVIEVSRGCPFLCEFCDIRILPDNNRPHNISPDLIVEELDFLCRNGVKQVLFACDNFIGTPRWAEEVVDKILEWEERTGFRPGLYTWLTINLYKFPELMVKMRRAGFDMLFIGVESFDSNSLIETAKVQNTTKELVGCIRDIQSYGFIVVAGLIFGFDSDGPEGFENTLEGLSDSALLSGDPSLLTALPGTPLYRRMKLSGRLRDVRFGLGGYKYQTNILYLMPSAMIVDGYKAFVDGFVDGAYQYNRLEGYFELLGEGNFIPLKRPGFGNLWLFLSMLLKDGAALRQMMTRLGRFAARPSNLFYALKGLALVIKHRHIQGGFVYFQFWFFAWTNALLKYRGLSDRDFDIDSIPEGYDVRRVLPDDYESSATERIPQEKIHAQLRSTKAQLEVLIEKGLAG